MKADRKTKLRLFLAVGIAGAILFTGCGAVSKNYSNGEATAESAACDYDGGYDDTGAGTIDAGQLENGLTAGEGAEELNQNRKIVYTADVSMETETYEETVEAIRKALSEAGGYIESTSQSGSSEEGNRYCDLTCKVPAEKYQDFLSGLSGAGNVYSISQQTDDITAQYIDVDARLDSLQNQKERLEELADGAEDIETLLSIEDKLSDVQYQLESYTAQMRTYENQLSYSTVSIWLSEVRKVSEGTGFGTKIRAAFSGSWENFVEGAQDFVIFLIYALPGLVILGIAAAVIVPLSIRHHKKVKARLTAQAPYQAPGRTPDREETQAEEKSESLNEQK